MADFSQNLSTNLGYNPFGNQRRTTAPVMRRMDGFSDDGLSYEVINDWGKLASQALAEYEARIANPRTDLFGRVRPEDSPAALDAELFQPLRNLFGAGGNSQGMRTYEIDNALVGYNPQTGGVTKLFEAPKSKPEMTPRQKLEYQDLLAQRRSILSKPYYQRSKADEERLPLLDSAIKDLFPDAEAVSAPQISTAREPQIFIGNPTMTSTNAPAFQTKSGNKFKITPR